MNVDRTPENLLQLAGPLLATTGLATADAITRLPGGGNNRVHRLDTAAGPLLLKEYFQHPGDERDRLAAEMSFSRFAWSHGVRMLPEPLAADHVHGLGLYRLVTGRRLAADEVTSEYVRQAASFFRAVNEHRTAPEAARLPTAAEACFSLADHVACVDRRVVRLASLEPASALHNDAALLVRQRLEPLWRDVRISLAATAEKVDTPLEAMLPPSHRRLNPSDFGFHNALLGADGRLWFLDFEYAGWDDPAKTVCDFFCQPAVPVDRRFCADFPAAIMDSAAEAAAVNDRTRLLLPAYEVKWCCIMLNEFLPVGDSRRGFAAVGDAAEARRRTQLRKVIDVLDRLGA